MNASRRNYFRMVLDAAQASAARAGQRRVVCENTYNILVVTVTGLGFPRVLAACYPDGRTIIDAECAQPGGADLFSKR